MDEDKARSAFEHALRTYHQDFETFFLARFFGLAISYGDDTCQVTMPVSDFMFNPQGSLHGGVTALLLDISMGHLLKRHVGTSATLEMNVQYMKAAREGTLTATGSFIRKGRQICFLRAELRDAQDAIIASATSTWKVL